MDRALPEIKRFFQGTSKPVDIKESWDCLSGALQTFETHVRGESRDRYSAQELRRFIEYFFMKESKISDPLLTEVMRLKQTVLGGELDSLTREELKQTYAVIRTLRDETIKLAPFMKILTVDVPDPSSTAEREYIEQGIAQISGSARVIGSLLGRSQNPYLLSDMETLLREFEALFRKGDNPWGGPGQVIKHLPLISALKAFFLRPTGSAIAPDEWQELVSKAARLFGLYLRAHFLFPKELTTGEGLRQVTAFTTEVFSLLEESVRIKSNKTVEFREVDNLVEQIYELDMLTMPVTKLTAKSTLRAFFEKVTNPMADGVRANVYGITDTAVQWLKKDVYGWQEVQSVWANLAGGSDAITVEQLRERWAQQKFLYPDTAEEISHLINRAYPLVFRGQHNVVLERPMAQLKVDERHWTSMNWKRFLIRWATRGFSFDFPAQKFSGITKDKFKELWDDVTPVLFEMKILKPADYILWTTTFDEANIFLPAGDGNKIASYAEGMEALSFILSGSYISVPIFDKFLERCRQVGEENGSVKVELGCARELIKAHYKDFYGNYPYWVEMMSRFDDEKWEEFLDSLFLASRNEPTKNDPVQIKNITKQNVIFSYIESVYLRFDTDNSRTLSVKESQVAYPLLRDLLKSLSGFENESDIMALYTYLIKYGEAPDKNLANKLRWLWWKTRKGSWKYEADRMQLLRVVSNLNTSNN